MTVENATYIDTLNSALPPGTDPKGEGDDHIRLIKAVLKSTFPNIKGAVTLSDVDLNTGFVKKAGDQMVGSLSFQGASPTISFQTQYQVNGSNYTTGVEHNSSGVQEYFISNALNSLRNLRVMNTGDVYVAQNFFAGGSISTAQQAQFAGITIGYGGAKPRFLAQDPNLGGHGGGVGFLNNARNAWTFYSSDDGTAFSGGTHYFGSSSTFIQTDGNVFGGAFNGYLTTYIGTATAATVPQYNSGVTEFVNVITGGNYTSDCGNPWVMCGLRTSTGQGWIYPHAIQLRTKP